MGLCKGIFSSHFWYGFHSFKFDIDIWNDDELLVLRAARGYAKLPRRRGVNDYRMGKGFSYVLIVEFMYI